MPTMTRKNDLICWVILSEVQQKIYRDFIITPAVKEVRIGSDVGGLMLTICIHKTR